MKINFKMMMACLCAAGSMNGFSQTEQYLRASLNGGISTLQYSSDEISTDLFSSSSLGGGLTAEYFLFFNKYIGASAGVGVTMSRSKYELNDVMSKEMSYYSYDDRSTKSFVYNANFENWGEKQTVYTIDVPVSVAGRYSFSDKITAMANMGVKFQFPIKATYKVADGSKRTSTGYFQDANVVLSKIPHQGFYTLDHALDGDLDTKDLVIAAFLDLGVMQKIGSQHFYYGIYGQLGVTPLNVETSNEFLTQFGIYNSPLNTTEIDKVRLVSLGIKLGYVLPVRTNSEEAEKTEEDSTYTGIKPEMDDHPYTTVHSESSESPNMNEVKETESVNGEESK